MNLIENTANSNDDQHDKIWFEILICCWRGLKNDSDLYHLPNMLWRISSSVLIILVVILIHWLVFIKDLFKSKIILKLFNTGENGFESFQQKSWLI